MAMLTQRFIHPDTVSLKDHPVLDDYPNQDAIQLDLQKEGNLYYPDYLDLPVGKENFLYVVPLLSKVAFDAEREYSFTIPNDVIAAIKNGAGHLVIDHSCDFYDMFVMDQALVAGRTGAGRALTIIRNTMNRYALKPQHVIVLNAASNFTQQSEHFYTSQIEFCDQMWDYTVSSDYLEKNYRMGMETTHRASKMLTLMGTTRPHRVEFAKFIYDNDYLRHNIVSLVPRESIPGPQDAFVQSLPWVIDKHDTWVQFDSPEQTRKRSDCSPEIVQAYLDTYMGFVVDSAWRPGPGNIIPQNHATEKVRREIVMMKPFILFGCTGALCHLKDLGYQTFSAWWDESYDHDLPGEQRLNLLRGLYSKISQASHSELSSMFKEMIPVLEYNRDVYITRIKQKRYLENFKSLLREVDQGHLPYPHCH